MLQTDPPTMKVTEYLLLLKTLIKTYKALEFHMMFSLISDCTFVSFCTSSMWHFCPGPVRVRPPGWWLDTLRSGWHPLQHRRHLADNQQGRSQLVASKKDRGRRHCGTHPKSRTSGNILLVRPCFLLLDLVTTYFEPRGCFICPVRLFPDLSPLSC